MIVGVDLPGMSFDANGLSLRNTRSRATNLILRFTNVSLVATCRADKRGGTFTLRVFEVVQDIDAVRPKTENIFRNRAILAFVKSYTRSSFSSLPTTREVNGAWTCRYQSAVFGKAEPTSTSRDEIPRERIAMVDVGLEGRRRDVEEMIGAFSIHMADVHFLLTSLHRHCTYQAEYEHSGDREYAKTKTRVT